MLVVFPPSFVADRKVINYYNFVAPLIFHINVNISCLLKLLYLGDRMRNQG